jgi:5-methylcytosine-specific restriction endonuclease McrA
MIPAFPKPHQVRRVPKYLCEDGVFRYPNGREVCQLTSTKGAAEYQRRKRVAWEAQKRTCSICHQKLNWADASVDHIVPRKMGGSARDDRQENIAAAHYVCNCSKGSKRY